MKRVWQALSGSHLGVTEDRRSCQRAWDCLRCGEMSPWLRALLLIGSGCISESRLRHPWAVPGQVLTQPGITQGSVLSCCYDLLERLSGTAFLSILLLSEIRRWRMRNLDLFACVVFSISACSWSSVSPTLFSFYSCLHSSLSPDRLIQWRPFHVMPPKNPGRSDRIWILSSCCRCLSCCSLTIFAFL